MSGSVQALSSTDDDSDFQSEEVCLPYDAGPGGGARASSRPSPISIEESSVEELPDPPAPTTRTAKRNAIQMNGSVSFREAVRQSSVPLRNARKPGAPPRKRAVLQTEVRWASSASPDALSTSPAPHPSPPTSALSYKPLKSGELSSQAQSFYARQFETLRGGPKTTTSSSAKTTPSGSRYKSASSFRRHAAARRGKARKR